MENKKKLVFYLHQNQPMHAHFTQTIISKQGSFISKASGQIWLQHYQLRFLIQKPFQQIILLQQHHFQLIEPQLKQVTQGTINHQITQSFAQILATPETLYNQPCKVTLIPETHTFQIHWPPSKKSNIHALTLTFNQPNTLDTISWQDPFQHKTTLTFHHVQQPKMIAAHLFTFKAPKDWAIINPLIPSSGLDHAHNTSKYNP
jgi:outer membrane lipoprotein-sorting protein